ncbi:ATP12 family chaperone protein [Enterovirga aerilata]|uniref:ATPase n=1 Tax=Enterovirga aerilata TaxID=2730920 RepID=A0A849I7A5_9HYPH|nr:ATP12 family protein [Enterovirga sp. DB1703]NNM72279.1 ATPase [Enterovirga sp. DB1703]
MAGTPIPAATRRFYEQAGIAEDEGGFALTLDGRRARTPGRAPLTLPTRALAEAIAREWQAQGASIDPTTMPLTRLANSTIDGVVPRAEEVRADLVRYAGSDLVVYRASGPDRLVAEQAAAWDPVHAFVRDSLSAHFVLSEGVMFVEQPAEAVAAVREEIARETSPFALAALHVMTTLTGSVLIALMHAAGRLPAEEAWRAAHVDEFFQESRWGEDHEASERRKQREAEFRAASLFLQLSRAG